MNREFSAKELYEVSIKATHHMRVGNLELEPDEVFLYFENVQLAALQSKDTSLAARGGRHNLEQIIWNSVDQIDFVFEKGVASINTFGLFGSTTTEFSDLSVPVREEGISSLGGILNVEYRIDTDRACFAYKAESGAAKEKLRVYSAQYNAIDLGNEGKSTPVIVDYYTKRNNVRYQEIGGENLQGYFKLTGKVNLVGEKDGKTTTALIVLPRVKFMSNIGLVFGRKANPIISNMRVRALSLEDGTLARIIYLEEDFEG